MSIKRIEAAIAACEASTAKLVAFVGMVQVRTDDLTGPALDWATAKASDTAIDDSRGKELRIGTICSGLQTPWMPSTNWSQCGPLLASLGEISIINRGGTKYHPLDDYLIFEYEGAQTGCHAWKAEGPTLLIAVCRAIVSLKLGDTVPVPSELCETSPNEA